MTSTNGWLKKITSRAYVVQETAKTRIAQLTDTLDKKLKEAQDDLEKQRLKAEASRVEVPQQNIWRPSGENPDGQILTMAKPPPLVLPTVPTLPELSPTPSPPVEPPTIPHAKVNRRVRRQKVHASNSSPMVDPENDLGVEQKSRYINQRNHRMEVTLCLDGRISEIIDQEDVAACLNNLIDILSTVDEMVERAAYIDALAKEELTSSSESVSNRPKTPTEIDTNADILLSTAPDRENIEIDPGNDQPPTITPTPDDLIESTDMKDTLTPMSDTAVNTIEQTLPVNDALTSTSTNDALIESLYSELILADTPMEESPPKNSYTDEPVKHIGSTDNLLTSAHAEDPSDIRIDSQMDELVTRTAASDISITQSHSENGDTNEMNNDSLNSTSNDSPSVERTDSDDVESLPKSHIESADSQTILVNFTIQDRSESETDSETSGDEPEAVSERAKIVSVPLHQSAEEIVQKSTNLADLRKFLSNIENDANTDEEALSTEHDIQVTKEIESKLPEEKHADTSEEDIFLTSLTSSHSISVTTTTDNLPDSPSDDLFVNSIKGETSSIASENKVVEAKRFPTVNHHSTPPATKVLHITCSSTYIYVCTNERKIFYAKLRSEDISLPFKWQIHSDLAERLIVSVTNRTVWRLLNKQLFSSNDPMKFPPIGSTWNPVQLGTGLLSISINDECGWYIKQDGSLWLVRLGNVVEQPLNVTCPFNLNTVVCFGEKVGVTTADGEILIRVGCTNECPEGDGWIFIDHNFGPIDDFVLLPSIDTVFIVDRKHHLWIHQWSAGTGFFEVLCDDDYTLSRSRYLTSGNAECLCLTDREEQVQIFSDCITGFQWKLIEKNTRLQRLIGAFANEDHVWTLTTDRIIRASNGQILEKPRQAQYLTHATFVPNNFSDSSVLWTLDESCNIYVRPNVDVHTPWEQLDQSQFEWTRRLVHMVCNHAGVWAVDDRGFIHFRHGHISASQTVHNDELSFLPPAWITIPGEARKHRYFSQVFCGPADWMVYATDNKQTVYARLGINEENRVGTSWKAIEDCSALELAISEHSLWLLTSCGEIQCRENISLLHPTGTRSTTLPGHFLSLTVSADDSQMWALDSKRNVLKLDRLTVLFEK